MNEIPRVAEHDFRKVSLLPDALLTHDLSKPEEITLNPSVGENNIIVESGDEELDTMFLLLTLNIFHTLL